MQGRRRRLALSAAALLGGCAYLTPPIANPTGLPPEALTLEYVLDRGCFAYALDGESEAAAMRSARLNHIHPLPIGLMPGDSAPFWMNNAYPGSPRVNVGGDVCNTVIRSRNVEGDRAAVEQVLRRRFGAAPPDAPASAYKAWVPGEIAACRQGVRYAEYAVPGRPIFEVDLTRVDCARDRLRIDR